jgi:RimJ/RimL family protein N-acetyltransferase
MLLRTVRLLLRDLTPEDGAALRRFSLEPASQEYDMPDPISQWDFDQMVAWMLDSQHTIPRLYYYLGVARLDNPSETLGSVHLTVQSQTRREGEIGYLFGTAYHNQGYATEAARGLLAYGFQVLKLRRIVADDIISENAASIRVAEKLGMQQVEHRANVQYFRGRWWDTVTYAILREQWLAQQTAGV